VECECDQRPSSRDVSFDRRVYFVAALLAWQQRARSVQDGATGGKHAAATTSGSGASGRRVGAWGSGGGPDRRLGRFHQEDAAMPTERRTGRACSMRSTHALTRAMFLLQADARADVRMRCSMDAPALPARVLLYHFTTFTHRHRDAQLAFLKSKLGRVALEADDSITPILRHKLARYVSVAMVNT